MICILSALASCNSESTGKIGFLLPNLTDGRYPKDKEFFVQKARLLGFDVEVGDANNDFGIQEAQAIKMVDKGIKVIVLSAVNQNLAASIVRYAHDKGVTVIAYERLVQNCKLDYFVAFDHYLVGELQANYAIAHKPEGNYVLIGGDKSDKNAELIRNGQMNVIHPLIKSSKIDIVYSCFVEDWNATGAYNEMKRVINLSGKRIDVVLCSNDGMAQGIIKAIEESQPDYPAIVTGLDADISSCKMIAEGKQSMTVYKPFKKEAELTAELAVTILKGKNVASAANSTFNGEVNVPTIKLQPVSVDVNNLKQTVIKDGQYKETEIYKENGQKML